MFSFRYSSIYTCYQTVPFPSPAPSMVSGAFKCLINIFSEFGYFIMFSLFPQKIRASAFESTLLGTFTGWLDLGAQPVLSGSCLSLLLILCISCFCGSLWIGNMLSQLLCCIVSIIGNHPREKRIPISQQLQQNP